MATAFPAPPAKFVGREPYLARFKSRVDHFTFFIYEGNSGIGKTHLIMRLAKEARAVGCTKSVYLTLSPGEAIGSILARVEARLKVRAGATQDRQGDPYARLADLLDNHKTVVLLDELHNLRREDTTALARALKDKRGKFRIIGATRVDPDLPAIDRTGVVLERVGPFNVDEVKKVATSHKVRGEALEMLLEDAARGGSVCQPLTLRAILALFGADNLPSAETLKKHSARSVNAFKALLSERLVALPEAELKTLRSLILISQPVAKSAATKAFGSSVDKLINQHVVDVFDGDVYVHRLITQIVGDDVKLSSQQAKVIAKHLESSAVSRSEPVGVIRAGEILAHAGAVTAAVDTLSEGWDSVRDFGFLEAYLKTLASIPKTGTLGPRIKLLSARARMRKGNPAMVKDQMEELSKSSDTWTKVRAHAALMFIYSQAHDHKGALRSFETLRSGTTNAELIIPSGILAAQAMTRLGKVAEAEKLAKQLLTKLKGKRDYARQGELHRLLARLYAQAGNLKDAVSQAQQAAKCFESAGDLYHAATAQGFIGDLYRETGDFELAREAFQRFHQLADTWGDRNLIQIAELAEAWVLLDIGDLTHASRQIDTVEKEMSAAPSRRLKRYLAAARALLEAGRGHHEEAAASLPRVVELWSGAGQRAIADVLRAQLVRSLIASGRIDDAEEIVKQALQRLDEKTSAPRVASFLRESALIRLRRKDGKKAMAELSRARKLFAKGGNRREEALTLHRIAHAALDEGDVELAKASAKEALTLAKKIKHNRATALASEVLGRASLMLDDSETAAGLLKEASQSLRKLGDEVGTMHVSESLLRAQIASGDLASAIRLGPRLREHAERLEVREVRIRAIILTGVALLRRGKLGQATKCFKELPDAAVTPLTEALMWRLGEALASVNGERSKVLERRGRWARSVRRLPDHRQGQLLLVLEQLVLPPRDRLEMRSRGRNEVIGSESVGFLNPTDFDLFIDFQDKRYLDSGEPVAFGDNQQLKLFRAILLQSPRQLSFADACQAVFGKGDQKPQKKVGPVLRELQKSVKRNKNIKIVKMANGLKLAAPKTYAYLIPRTMDPSLKPQQRRMLTLLARYGSAPVQMIQDEFKLTRAAARKELGYLVDGGFVETIREGRGQAFRLI